jgi:hypothetical protein
MNNLRYCSCVTCKSVITSSGLAWHDHNRHQVIYPKPGTSKEVSYRLSPTLCKQCKSQLSYKDSQAKKIFCGHSCSATYNNLRKVSKYGTFKCLSCGVEGLPKRQNQNKYCSIKCQQSYIYNTFISDWLSGKESGVVKNGTKGAIKRYILSEQDNKCNHCGNSDWMGKKLVLELEHKDGNSDNNARSNLECLCPNCHSLTPTYRNKNKGNGRHSRRLRYSLGKSS